MKFANNQIKTNESLGASFSTDAILLDQIYGFNFQAILTGSPNGTFKLQASNDDVKEPTMVSNWVDIADSSQAVTTSGSIMWDYNGAFFKWVRVVFTFSSGSGAATIIFSAKGA